jgi:adenylate cyclase
LIRPGRPAVVPKIEQRRQFGLPAALAVIYADMAEYNRLICLDDTGTFERLREMRRDLIDPAIARHGGTLVSTGGDSLLVRFDSIIPAMRFAVDVQRGVPDFDGDYPPDRRIRLRMGVNFGDAIPDGTNLHGEGVNVAAPLQSVCPPGAICVPRVVRDRVGNRIGLKFEQLGPLPLKNIAQPVEAFAKAGRARKPRFGWLDGVVSGGSFCCVANWAATCRGIG